MNLVVLMGRLTRDPEVRYSQGAEAKAVARYSLAVNRSYKKDGESEADFINIVAFGKAGEFAGKFFKKGMMVAVEGELRISQYTDKDGNKRWSTDVVVNRQHFAGGKKEESTNDAPAGRGYGTPMTGSQQQMGPQDFVPVDDVADEDLPF